MKVAICISGQMRTYRQTLSHLRDNLIEHCSADVFVHTWDLAGNTNKLILFLPRGFHFKAPLEYWHAQPDLLARDVSLFEATMPSLFRELQSIARAGDEVRADELRNMYGAIAVETESFNDDIFRDRLDLDLLRHAFPDATCLNTAPMFYKIWACDQLRQNRERESGITYDLVIRTRPDLLFPGPVDVMGCDKAGIIATLNNPYYAQLGIEQTHANDMFFCGGSEEMSRACRVWEMLPQYWNPAIDPEWPLCARGPELILRRHLSLSALEHDILHVDPAPHRVVPGISFDRMLELLRKDFPEGATMPAFIAEIVGVCQAIHGVDLFMNGNKEGAEAVLAKTLDVGRRVCVEPFVGRAKMAQLQGDAQCLNSWLPLARAAGQEQAFPDLFSS